MQLIATEKDPVTGITEQYLWDHQTEKLTINRVQDIELTLDSNLQQRNAANRVGYSDSNGLHKIAEIPLIMLEKWLREDGFDWFKSTDKERRKKLMQNPKFLTRRGRLI